MSEYQGIFGGTCFKCNRVGTDRILTGGIAEAAKIAARWNKKRERIALENLMRAERIREEVATWREDHADVVAYFTDHDMDFFTGKRGWMKLSALNVRDGGRLDPEMTGLIREQITREKKWAEQDAERAKTAKTVGEIGDRLKDLQVTIAHVHVLYGTAVSYRGNDYRWVTFHTAEGDVLKWKTTVDIDEDAKGSTATLTGTVKAHDTYRGIPQTILTRCRLTRQ